VTRVSRDVVSGMSEAEAAKISRNDKPIMVYIYNDLLDEEARYSIEEASAFGDDKVAVGARLFDCVRIDIESAKKDRMLADHLGRENTLVMLRPNFKFSKAIVFKKNKVKARSVFAAMCATMKLDYKNCVATTYKKMKAIQKERSKLTPEQRKIDQIDEKILNEDSAKKRDKLVANRDKMQEKLDGSMAKLDQKEDQLFNLVEKASANAKKKDCSET
jgi:hypothetical protein